ncbi:MAG: hypothetical protein ACJ76N_23945 [Thermoanaerobaculia bacterium]
MLTIGSTHVGSLEKTAMAGIPGEARWGLRVPFEIDPRAIDSLDFIAVSLHSPDPPQALARTDLFRIEISIFAVAGTFRQPDAYYPWLAQISEDGRVLWQKRYPTGGYAYSVAISPQEEILAGGGWDDARGLYLSSLTRDRRNPGSCSVETRGVFSPVCLKSEVGPKNSETLDVVATDFAARSGPPVRMRLLCPAAN